MRNIEQGIIDLPFRLIRHSHSGISSEDRQVPSLPLSWFVENRLKLTAARNLVDDADHILQNARELLIQNNENIVKCSMANSEFG